MSVEQILPFVLIALAVVVPVLAVLLVLRRIGRTVQAKGRDSWPYQLLAVILFLVGAVLGAGAGAYVALEIMDWKGLSWAKEQEATQPKEEGDKASKEGKPELKQESKEVQWLDGNKSPLAIIYLAGLLGAVIGLAHGLLFAHDARPADASRTASRLREPSPGQPQFRLRARFQRRMKLHKVAPVFVELSPPVHGRAPAATDAPLLVHLSVPGAQVTPAEVPLDIAQPGARAQFLVTPLAYGWLNQAHLEVRHRGQLVQQTPLAMRGSSNAVTWFLAALTVLVPAFVLYATHYHKLEGTIHRPPSGVKQPEPAKKGAGVQAVGPHEADALKPKNAKGGDKPQSKQVADTRPGAPGELLEREILDHTYPIPYVTQPVARFLGIVYDYACMWSAPKEQYLAFWLALFFGALTFAAWVRHLGFYTSQLSKPFGLAAATGEVHAARTAPRHGEEPIRISPVKD
jgi:hypothetical protein